MKTRSQISDETSILMTSISKSSSLTQKNDDRHSKSTNHEFQEQSVPGTLEPHFYA